MNHILTVLDLFLTFPDHFLSIFAYLIFVLSARCKLFQIVEEKFILSYHHAAVCATLPECDFIEWVWIYTVRNLVRCMWGMYFRTILTISGKAKSLLNNYNRLQHSNQNIGRMGQDLWLLEHRLGGAKNHCKLATLSRRQKPMLPGGQYLSMLLAGRQSLQFFNEFIKWWSSVNIFQCFGPRATSDNISFGSPLDKASLTIGQSDHW